MSSRFKVSPFTTHTFKALSALAPSLLRPVFKKRGFYDTRLIHEWPSIIGTIWAARTFPDKLVYARNTTDATLYIRTSSAEAFLMRQAEPQIIERINTYFGRTMVSSLKFITDRHSAPSPASRSLPLLSSLPSAPNNDDCPADSLSSPALESLPDSLKHALLGLEKALREDRER